MFYVLCFMIYANQKISQEVYAGNRQKDRKKP